MKQSYIQVKLIVTTIWYANAMVLLSFHHHNILVQWQDEKESKKSFLDADHDGHDHDD